MSIQHFEQQLSLYTNIKIYCAIAALIFLIAAIILFFVLKIPAVFAELTGKKAKQAVRQMTEDNSGSGFLKSSRLDTPENLNTAGAEKKERIVRSDSSITAPLNQKKNDTSEGSEQTEVLQSGENATEVLGGDENATEVLGGDENATEVLGADENATEVLGADENATEILDAENPITEKLSNKTSTGKSRPDKVSHRFVIEKSIVDIHTDKVV